MYGRKIEPGAGKHRILGWMIHVQVLDGVGGTDPGSGNKERHAQPIVHLQNIALYTGTACSQWQNNFKLQNISIFFFLTIGLGGGGEVLISYPLFYVIQSDPFIIN